MRRRAALLARAVGGAVAVAALLASDAPADGAPPANHRVTDDATGLGYVGMHGASDGLLTTCRRARQSQNEPSVAVDPRNSEIVAIGANEGCTVADGGFGWIGYYRSTDGGSTWAQDLVPGYPGDVSPAAQRGRIRFGCKFASDPSLAFDSQGRLYFAILCIGGDEAKRANLFVARYDSDGTHFAGDSLVAVSSRTVEEDKPALAVDTSDGPHAGVVYVVWTEFPSPSDCPVIYEAHSGDHGHLFSEKVLVSGFQCGHLSDVTVGSDGSVYVAFRSETDMWITHSRNGGESFPQPLRVAHLDPFDSTRFGEPTCGDGPAACTSGMTYPRFSTAPSLAVDGAGVHVVWAASYASGQSKVFIESSEDGVEWGGPATVIDRSRRGHELFPDVASGAGALDIVFYDSRLDPAYSATRPPGLTSDGRSSGAVLQVVLARSTDGGRTWTERPLSTAGTNPNLEVVDFAREPFMGDYISVSLSAGGGGYAAWTDSRDVVLGTDARDPDSASAGRGFDVFAPCSWFPESLTAKIYKSPAAGDFCLQRGGFDQNIYGARVP